MKVGVVVYLREGCIVQDMYIGQLFAFFCYLTNSISVFNLYMHCKYGHQQITHDEISE